MEYKLLEQYAGQRRRWRAVVIRHFAGRDELCVLNLWTATGDTGRVAWVPVVFDEKAYLNGMAEIVIMRYPAACARLPEDHDVVMFFDATVAVDKKRIYTCCGYYLQNPDAAHVVAMYPRPHNMEP